MRDLTILKLIAGLATPADIRNYVLPSVSYNARFKTICLDGKGRLYRVTGTREGVKQAIERTLRAGDSITLLYLISADRPSRITPYLVYFPQNPKQDTPPYVLDVAVPVAAQEFLEIADTLGLSPRSILYV